MALRGAFSCLNPADILFSHITNEKEQEKVRERARVLSVPVLLCNYQTNKKYSNRDS